MGKIVEVLDSVGDSAALSREKGKIKLKVKKGGNFPAGKVEKRR